jgi:hypothetical protein
MCAGLERGEKRRRVRVVSRYTCDFPAKKTHIGPKRMQHAPKLSGVVLVKHEDGVLRILLVARRSACVFGERVEDLAGDRKV